MTDEFETPIIRDLMKIITSLSIGCLIALTLVFIVFIVIPFFEDWYDFLTTGSCVYFEELEKSLCGDEMREYFDSKKPWWYF